MERASSSKMPHQVGKPGLFCFLRQSADQGFFEKKSELKNRIYGENLLFSAKLSFLRNNIT
jgi:hypothetical protein